MKILRKKRGPEVSRSQGRVHENSLSARLGKPARVDRALADMGTVARPAASRRLMAGDQGAAAIATRRRYPQRPALHLPVGINADSALLHRRRCTHVLQHRPRSQPRARRDRPFTAVFYLGNVLREVQHTHYSPP